MRLLSAGYEDRALLPAEDIEENQAAEGSSSRLRFRRPGLILFLLAVAAIAVVCVHEVRNPSYLRISSDGLISEIGGWQEPIKVHPSCPDLGGVCFCAKEGLGPTVSCENWVFEVGDALLMGCPGLHFWFMKYVSAYVNSMVQQSPITHVGIVVSVPPAGTRQTPANVIIGESVRPQGIAKASLQNIIQRYPWGSLFLRRVDPARFPQFHSVERKLAMQQFTNSQIGHVFDDGMINPATRKNDAGYIPVPPTCADMHQALNLYEHGGLSKWMCSQFATWVWAFAGGLNTDYNYGTVVPGCDLKPWTIPNMQQLPGEFLIDKYNVYEPGSAWSKSCGNECFVALPTSVPHSPNVAPDGTSDAIGISNAPVDNPLR